MRTDGPGYSLSSWKSSSDSGRYLQNSAAIDIFLQDAFPAFGVLMPWDFQHHMHCCSAWQPWMDFSSVNMTNHFWTTWHFCILNSCVKASHLYTMCYVKYILYSIVRFWMHQRHITVTTWRCKEEKLPQVSSVNQRTCEAAVWGLVAQEEGILCIVSHQERWE